MPMQPPKVSVVIPIRNAEHRIAAEIQRVLEALTDLSRQRCELIIVDDGSTDSTPEVLDEMTARYPQVRVSRHSKPRGIEAAGQTGIEKATGEIVFIQEDNRPVRLEDMRRLFRMSEDQSIVAARAESTPRPLSGAILRRLKAWGGNAAQTLREEPAANEPTGLQMIRRPHLQHLASPMAAGVTLRSEILDLTSVS
jgi:glycosyltransferase involved in cell wall biosynthesis